MEVRGVRPPDLPTIQALTKSDLPLGHALILVIYAGLFYLNLHYCIIGGGLGRGLAPTHGFIHTI
jgi:hypothetical protein